MAFAKSNKHKFRVLLSPSHGAVLLRPFCESMNGAGRNGECCTPKHSHSHSHPYGVLREGGKATGRRSVRTSHLSLRVGLIEERPGGLMLLVNSKSIIYQCRTVEARLVHWAGPPILAFIQPTDLLPLLPFIPSRQGEHCRTEYDTEKCLCIVGGAVAAVCFKMLREC